ncbi:hypothetical protein HMPREF2140_01935 [Hoylesella buccalis DNF00985]|nr:hypothetical protein HMPREF2140_01935 [Hoylesella buccalis DNF00985]
MVPKPIEFTGQNQCYWNGTFVHEKSFAATSFLLLSHFSLLKNEIPGRIYVGKQDVTCVSFVFLP